MKCTNRHIPLLEFDARRGSAPLSMMPLFGRSIQGRGSAIILAACPSFFRRNQRVAVATTETSDTHFFNSFSVVLGILILTAIILFAGARLIGEQQVEHLRSEPVVVSAVHANIAPLAHEAIAGQDNAALAALDAPKAPAAAMDVPKSGEAAYTAVCSSCHGLGINGAPKIGDHAAWGPRIAQGKDALYTHAIGGKGNMPARGGTTWPDVTIRQAVDYMVSLNK